ncbi:MAG: hypothetical protein ACI8W8_000621, partial [Rhodothermales bacterium]
AHLIDRLYRSESYGEADRLLRKHFPQYVAPMMMLEPDERGEVFFAFRGLTFMALLGEYIAAKKDIASIRWVVDLPTLSERVWATQGLFQAFGI